MSVVLLLLLGCKSEPKPVVDMDGARHAIVAFQGNVDGEIEPCG